MHAECKAFIINNPIINNLKQNSMEELVKKIDELYAQFKADAAQQATKGNKAAGLRARKAALELGALMKEFRKVSNEAAKA